MTQKRSKLEQFIILDSDNFIDSLLYFFIFLVDLLNFFYHEIHESSLGLVETFFSSRWVYFRRLRGF